jgi:hypothetical protein
MRGQRVERGYADRRELFLRIEQDVVLEEGLEDVFEEDEEEYHKVVPSAQEVSEPNLAFTDISYLIFKSTSGARDPTWKQSCFCAQPKCQSLKSQP